MGRKFNTARFPLAGSGAPEIQEMEYTAGQTFIYGALVLIEAAGTIAECGADPTTVLGVSMTSAGVGPGYDMANASTTQFVTGRKATASVAIANRNTVFSCRGINGGTDPVTPAVTNIDEQYGVAKTAGGDWVLDIAETSAKVVEIVDIDVDNKIFFVKFLEAVLQRP